MIQDSAIGIGRDASPFARRLVFVLTLFAVLSPQGFGQKKAAEPSESKQGATSSIWHDRLSSDYNIDSILLDEGPDGPVGSFSMRGNIVPKARQGNAFPPASSAGEHREIAEAFLAEREELFGTTHANVELRERAFREDRHGNRHLSYGKYVHGLRVDGMEVLVHLDSGGRIFAVNGSFVALRGQSLGAIAQVLAGKTISEVEARQIIEEDLQQGASEPPQIERANFEMVAFPDPPYVIWKADVIIDHGPRGPGRWAYEIDAVSGRVLEKRDNLQTEGSPRGQSSDIRRQLTVSEVGFVPSNEIPALTGAEQEALAATLPGPAPVAKGGGQVPAGEILGMLGKSATASPGTKVADDGVPPPLGSPLHATDEPTAK